MATPSGSIAVGGIVVPIGIDSSPLTNDLRRITSDMDRWKAQQQQQLGTLRNLGLVMSAAISLPIEMFVKRAISESIQAEQISKRLDIALRNTGGAAGITRKEIDDLGESMLRMSNFTDEAVRSATASLLKFKGIRGDIFRDTLKASADMAAAMGMDLGSATQMLGRAMVNPGQGNDMLRRAGIVFNDPEKKRMKELNDSGNTSGAQRLMLNAINERTGGAAKDMAEPFTQMKNAFDELREATGAYTRKQFLLDDGAKVLRDVFLSLAKSVERTNNPFVAMAANLTAVVTKLPPLLVVVSQYAKSANDIKAAIGNFGPLFGLAKGAMGGATAAMGGSGAAATAIGGVAISEGMARALRMREYAKGSSAKAAELAAEVAANNAQYGTRFRPASVYAKEAQLSSIRELAAQQNGRATAAMQQVRMAEAQRFSSAASLPQGGLIRSGGAGLAGLIPQVAIAAAIAAVVFQIAKPIGEGIGKWFASMKWTGGLGAGADERNLKEAGEAQVRSDAAKAKRLQLEDEDRQRVSETLARQKAQQSDVRESYQQEQEYDKRARRTAMADSIGARQSANEYEIKAALMGTSERSGKQMVQGLGEDVDRGKIQMWLASQIQRFSGIDTDEAKTSLIAAKKTAADLYEGLAQRDELEKERVKFIQDSNKNTRETIAKLEQSTVEAETTSAAMDAFLKVIQESGVAPQSEDAMPQVFARMGDAERKQVYAAISNSKGKSGMGDLTDIGMMLQQKDTEFAKNALVGATGGGTGFTDLGVGFDSKTLSEWMDANKITETSTPEQVAEYNRISGEGQSLLSKEAQLKDSRLRYALDTESKSTWDTRNSSGAESTSLTGYQQSITRQKDTTNIESMAKNISLMPPFFSQLLTAVQQGGVKLIVQPAI